MQQKVVKCYAPWLHECLLFSFPNITLLEVYMSHTIIITWIVAERVTVYYRVSFIHTKYSDNFFFFDKSIIDFFIKLSYENNKNTLYSEIF